MATSWVRSTVNAWKIRGKQNLAAWAVAGGLAYYLWVKPERDALEEQRKERQLARDLSQAKPYTHIDRTRPQPDPQDTGVIRGIKKE